MPTRNKTETACRICGLDDGEVLSARPSISS